LAHDFYMPVTVIIGREAEKQLLDEVLAHPAADLVALYGRRRIGKTYLVRSYLQAQLVFEFSGIHEVSTEQQLANFTRAMALQLNKGLPLPPAANWFEAFDRMAALLRQKLRRKKAIVFLDEFPWMQTPKSNFLAAFENFWNTWASRQPTLAIIICGSAASWMIQHVVRNKGGLHNRITRKIALRPFSLHETELFLHSRKVYLNRYQVTQLYMAVGGVPLYLEQAKPGLSAAQIIDRECFNKSGFLYNEFNDLYKALFDKADRHLKVIRALSAKPMGLNRNQIIKTCRLQSGGSTTALLEELSASGFITPYTPLGKKTKDNIYKLTDEYSLFYLKFMESQRTGERGAWLRWSDTPSWRAWSGLAFETICLKHVAAIKAALGIHGIYSEAAIWKSKTTSGKEGAQIDLVINRRDNCMNLCEIKYYAEPFVIDKRYAAVLQQKKRVFKQETGTHKQLFTTLVTAMPLIASPHSIGLVDQQVVLDQLFLPTTSLY
jgi:uncharacterized protein